MLPLIPFTWNKYELLLTVEEPLLLPAYKGATLRGSFGRTLKRLSCTQDPSTCDAAPPGCHCPYGYLFAPRLPQPDPRLRAGAEIARPIVIQPPLDAKREYRPGETVAFHLLLFGKANEMLPWCIITWRELPPIGIAPQRGRVALQEIWAVDDLSGLKQRVCSASDQIVRQTDLAMSWEALAAMEAQYPTDRLTLQFQTNTILRYQGNKQGVRRIEFTVLISRLLQRVEALARLYGESAVLPADWPDAARQLIQAAKEVRIARDETEWNIWTRFSARQRQEVPMDGVIGKVTYAGDLRPYLPLLLLGQYTHVGKGCVFGLGRYSVLQD